MRISDWSSDVCSSDLDLVGRNSGIVLPAEPTGNVIPCLIVGMQRIDDLGRGQAAHHTADGHRVGIVSCVADPATHRRLYRKIMVAHQYFRSEEHTSELQSLMHISYAVFCLNKQK